ncbi:hypothetical protein [Flavobacterium reichenbachii]|uniref:Lipoprotein n=1 Tax=Flavobacterium reichenbachii TaxID=362418 RepID=A0A085ZPS1_9FLAO|nr:hypothetical protein [Flavobacterium reichenbachii]KFF06435.1 hypothetical protein IW19_13340 [Flavobacterium reichenbachii]OXB11890.1 hypothetical protein B0A68_20530 [Flavobacterium reichenbachii]
MKHLKQMAFLIAISFAIISCTSTKTALFDHYSYQKTTEIKVNANQLMSKAVTPYSTHKVEVESLILEIEKLTEYEKNKPNNEITFEMWKVLTDKEKNLLAGFFKNWNEKGILSPVFMEESKKQVLDALDLLIQYEIKKDKQSKEELLDLINLNT